MISQFGHTKHKSNLVRNLNSLVFKAELAQGKICLTPLDTICIIYRYAMQQNLLNLSPGKKKNVELGNVVEI